MSPQAGIVGVGLSREAPAAAQLAGRAARPLFAAAAADGGFR
jgi:hypothetical protein